jgi:hypothetical protein
MKFRFIILPLIIGTCSGILSMSASAQSALDATNVSTTVPASTSAQPDTTYTPPTETIKIRNYAFNAFGPLPILVAGVEAGIDQEDNSPPEWKQGAEGYGKRFGSDFAVEAVSTTTRYGLSQAFREDALYYRCDCRGVLPRLGHAVVSTLTARRGDDGHRVFSIPALIAPYAGSTVAVYGWYPSRYGAKDAFRMGNYTMLADVGANISLEFLYSSSHSLLSRMHLNNRHGAPDSGWNQ